MKMPETTETEHIDTTTEEEEEEEEEEDEESDLEIEDFSSDGKFPKSYRIKHEEAVSLEKIYVLNLTALFHSTKINLIATLSNFSCSLCEVEIGFRKKSAYQAHDDVITGLKYADEHLFYTGSLDGTIKLWDIREGPKPSLIFKDNSDGDGNLKAINSFDVSCDGKFIAAGTTLIEADAYVLFWDSRKAKVLGGYWETHTDDVTDIKFSPTEANTMISGSMDGLINRFDIAQSNEDDAFQDSLNVESAIRKLQWVDEYVGCVTDMETVQFWRVGDSRPVADFGRKSVASAMGVRSWDNAYVAEIHKCEEEVIVLGGSNLGKGEYLKAVSFREEKLHPAATFAENKQIVRCSCYDKGIFVTGGESGIISVWEAGDSYPEKMRLKERVKKSKQQRTK